MIGFLRQLRAARHNVEAMLTAVSCGGCYAKPCRTCEQMREQLLLSLEGK